MAAGISKAVVQAYPHRFRQILKGELVIPPIDQWLLFAGTAILLALSPGPNMFYLVSRSICQGPRAGVVSLLGVITGMTAYMLLTAFGISAICLAVPFLYGGLRLAGAAYLLWLAWQAIRPTTRALFEARSLPLDSHKRLYFMGLVTCVLNPKVMVFYVSLLPQFIDPRRGSVLAQSLVLGGTQVLMAFSTHLCVTLSAGTISQYLARRPKWISIQRYVMASVLFAIAVKLAFEHRRRA